MAANWCIKIRCQRPQCGSTAVGPVMSAPCFLYLYKRDWCCSNAFFELSCGPLSTCRGYFLWRLLPPPPKHYTPILLLPSLRCWKKWDERDRDCCHTHPSLYKHCARWLAKRLFRLCHIISWRLVSTRIILWYIIYTYKYITIYIIHADTANDHPFMKKAVIKAPL